MITNLREEQGTRLWIASDKNYGDTNSCCRYPIHSVGHPKNMLFKSSVLQIQWSAIGHPSVASWQVAQMNAAQLFDSGLGAQVPAG